MSQNNDDLFNNTIKELLYRKNFYEFAKEAFKVFENGTDIEDNWHINYLCKTLQTKLEKLIAGESQKNIIINIPPRSLKSFIVVIAFPAWAWLHKIDLKFVSSSYSSDLSIEHNLQCRRIIQSEWYQDLFEEVKISKDQNAKSKFELEGGGKRMSTSTGGSITGMGGDIIMIDDPTDPKRAESEVERNNANEHFDKTLSTRLNNPVIGFFIVIMQRLHEDDLTGHLLNTQPKEWEHICIPATNKNKQNVKPKTLIHKYKRGLFFPSRFPQRVLNKLLKSLQKRAFTGQYEQSPAPAEGLIFNKAWFEVIDYKRPVNPYIFIDSAYTEKTENDPSCIMVAERIANYMIVHEVHVVYLEFNDLINYIQEIVKRIFIRARIYIEPKASGKSIYQYLKKNTIFNVYQSPAPTRDKVERAYSIQPECSAGKVKVVKAYWNDAFFHELTTFPRSMHDDQVDTLIMAVVDLLIKGTRGVRIRN